LHEIRRLYRDDPESLARYNLEDCRLVREIFAKADLLNFAVERACLTGLALDRQGGSVAAFDFQYLPRLHREGYVAPSLREFDEAVSSPGGYVMDSKPGCMKTCSSSISKACIRVSFRPSGSIRSV
jgi:DNA polymerase II